ncbi:aminotransferase class III-fold pyridoxal phosphate-dependent enzyme [Crateriforma conspicua]|uniref:aminotransferase class III-fold pyridoxal phosphate-dependent enzyme n=1 Tax=Crateriforma conspicua TaxID=2527996 RepID=UPI00118781C1|nr:aminotransferase class III-fold pyridoxal phosphate-dependent enzyme [Crateriforma conspicua]QDV62933.1 Acetylornithine aminotransferase [Crateriforma conspicua]
MSDGQQYGGLWRLRDDQSAVIDAVCGRVSTLGLGDPVVSDAISGAHQRYLGDACSLNNEVGQPELAEELFGRLDRLVRSRPFTGSREGTEQFLQSATLCPCRDLALEAAVWDARTHSDSRFQILSLVGSEHGVTTLARTISGRPEMHEGFGPLVPGVVYVPADDVDALAQRLDETVACVVVQPADVDAGMASLSESWLETVSELCARQDVRFVVDESRLVFGGTGGPFSLDAIQVTPATDFLWSAGLFGGLPGGLWLRLGDQPADPSHAKVTLMPGTILAAKVLSATIAAWDGRRDEDADLPGRTMATALAEKVGGFEFVRDIQYLGTNLAIQSDIPGDEVVAAALQRGLILESTGGGWVRLQLPPTASESDWDELLSRMTAAMEALESETVDLG